MTPRFLYFEFPSITKMFCRIQTNPAAMEINEKIREQIFEIIKNQLRDNDHPETKATFDRLRNQ